MKVVLVKGDYFFAVYFFEEEYYKKIKGAFNSVHIAVEEIDAEKTFLITLPSEKEKVFKT